MAIRATAQQIIDRALGELGLPTSIIGSSAQSQLVIQCLGMLNSLGDDCVKVHDWQFLENIASFTGNGIVTQFAMPADFGRTVNQTEWSTNNKRPTIGPLSAQQWGWTQYGIVSVGVYFRYRVLDNFYTIFPVPAVGQNFQFYYIQKNWVIAADGTQKDAVTLPTDIVMFDRGLMISGLKLRLWAIKGFDTSTLSTDFNYRLQAEMGQDQGAPVIQLSGTDGFHYIDTSNVPDGSWSV